MKLLWPGFLTLLGLIPLIAAAYIWMQRRRRRFVIRYSSLSLVREALPKQSSLRRHLPFALFLAALGSLIFALGRPAAVTHVPAGQANIILTIDVSRSMLQEDIFPNRLEAAEEAANFFIQRQLSANRIGIVIFAGYAQLVQAPTTDQNALEAVVESLTTGRGTAIGSGIIEALNAIAEVNPDIEPVTELPPAAPFGGPAPEPTADVPFAPFAPLDEGGYAPDIIVLLTDGVTTTGPFPLDAAKQAADRRVRVYTIGFGTNMGGALPNERRSFPDEPQFGRGRFRRAIDEDTLKSIAAMTGGEYYTAESASELQEVFASLPTHLVTREELLEMSVVFAAVGALLTAAAVLLSLLWRPLP